MDDNLFAECERFISDNKKRYEKLLEDVLALAKYLRTIDTSHRIYRVYSRRDNQNEEGDFKKISKVAEKLVKWRKKYNPKSRAEDLHDIIGITIVVHYDSDISAVYEMIRNNHQSRHLKIVPYLLEPDAGAEGATDEFRHYKKLGYHARHMVLSHTSAAHGKLKCEVQIKTLLHDAWGAKTYSLIYKPPGELPDELRTVMEGFGESIQALEVQSEMVRSFVTRDWEEENELRYTSRLAMMATYEELVFEDEELGRRYREIFHRIQADQETLRACSPDDTLLEELLNEIARLKDIQGGASAAWRLMMYMASCRVDTALHLLARQYVEEWAEDHHNDPALKLFYISTACYVIGQRSSAITMIRKFLASKPENTVTIEKLRMNLLYYLIEEAVYSSYRASDIKAECEQIMKGLPFDDLDKFIEPAMRYAAIDTQGYYKIVFGETKQEIGEGILLCAKAYPEGEAEKLGGHYGFLHQRTGWRRYLRAKR